MLKYWWNWLAAGTLLVWIAALSGCGAGLLKTVEAAQEDSITIQTDLSTSRAAVQVTPAAVQASAKVGDAVNMKLIASGGDAPYRWTVASGSLPNGINLGSDGTFTGTPTTTGTWPSTLQIVDSSKPAKVKTQAVTFTVAPPTLRILTSVLGSARVGASVSQALSATGGTPNYTWSLKSGVLPAGLSLSNTGVLSGTPQSIAAAALILSVKDAGSPTQTALQPMVLVVLPPALDIATATLSSGQVNTPYTSALAANGGTPNYHWSLLSGTLPAGLSMDGTGTISGIPTATGTSNITVKLTDDGNPTQQVTKSLALTVAAPPLTITTGSPAAGQSAAAYATQLSATGGTPAYTWSITSGSLPSGLTLGATTGVIQGTPTSGGNSTFTYKVTDNGNPQQTATATASINVTALPAANTWFVRTDGGTRYSANNPAGQCNGKADVGYSGSGVNQNCAFNDVRYMWMDGTYGNSQWIMAGGDTLVIRGCAALPGAQNADAPHCRIGWDKATGNDGQNFWCAGVGAWWGCAMPPPPSGTATQHTRILGGCAYGNYSCNPVRGYPYTNNNLTQLYGSFNSYTVMWLHGTKYLDLEGLELTTHNGRCARYGTTHPIGGCNRSVSDGPLNDQADQGIVTNTATSNILLHDVYIHGFSSSGISGPIGGPFTLNNVSLDFNTFAGWNFDDGSSTPNAAGSSITQSYVTMVGNGCQEEYPITHTRFPAKGCWDTTSGGFGDAWSGQDAFLDSFTCDHCYISFNSKDAALGPHTRLKNLSLTNSYFGNNMGQQGKWGMQPNSTAYIVNNIIVGNCLRMSELIPGAAQNFDAGTNATGSGLSGYCRAAGDIFSFFSDSNSSVLIANNTVVAASPTVFDLSCSPLNPGGCGSTPYRFINNIFLGYTEPLGRSLNSGLPPGLYYIADGAVRVQASGNIDWGVRNANTCGTNGNLCVDPLLLVEPPQGTVPPDSTLDVLNFHLSPLSPAIYAGVSYSDAPTVDYFGTARVSSNIGAALP